MIHSNQFLILSIFIYYVTVIYKQLYQAQNTDKNKSNSEGCTNGNITTEVPWNSVSLRNVQLGKRQRMTQKSTYINSSG